MNADTVFIVIEIASVALFLLNLYFLFRALTFFRTSTSFYKKIIIRQDASIDLLLDIRDKTKAFEKSSIQANEKKYEEDILSITSPEYSKADLEAGGM